MIPYYFLGAIILWLDLHVKQTRAVPFMPRKGLSLCNLYISALNQRTLKCHVKRGELLDYRELRQWSAREKGGKYAVEIHCSGGMVHLPWPFKAQNVDSLQVDGCKIQGLLSEMTMQQTVPDELRRLELISSTVIVPFSEMFDLRNHLDQIPRETDCGPATLETFVIRDVHYDLKMSPEERDRMPGLLSGALGNSGHDVVKKSCVYPVLKYVDESGSRRSGHYHLNLLPEYSQFPNLEVYNMSRNDLSHVPNFFKSLHSDKFPALKHLDFSNNFLHSFEFEFPDALTACSLRIVDLHNNRISSVPTKATLTLQAVGTILVDLRENPLRCSCQLRDFRQYLKRMFAVSQDISMKMLLSNITCNLRPFYHTHIDKLSLLDSTFDQKCLL